MEKVVNDVKTPILSKTEVKVLEQVMRGYSEKEIAVRLNCSRHTVNNHLRHIRKNNGLTKNTEVIFLYIAYVKKQKFSLKKLRELGLGAIMIFLNVCPYT